MFYLIAKILEPLERPDDFLLLLLFVGMVLLWFGKTRTKGIAVTTLTVLVLTLVTILSLPAGLSRPLENRFSRPRMWPSHVDGLIVLGGAVDPNTTAKFGLPTLNGDAERMTEFVRLAKLYPTARLVFSGGQLSLGRKILNPWWRDYFFSNKALI